MLRAMIENYPLAFEELPLEGRVMVLDDVLSLFNHDERTDLVIMPEVLGLLCEAHLAQIDPVVLWEFLDVDDALLLGRLTERALLERLPRIRKNEP